MRDAPPKSTSREAGQRRHAGAGQAADLLPGRPQEHRDADAACARIRAHWSAGQVDRGAKRAGSYRQRATTTRGLARDHRQADMVAPGDEQVQRLLSSPPGRGVSSMPAAAQRRGRSRINEAEIEELSEDDIESWPATSPRPARALRRRPQRGARACRNVSAPEVEVGSEAAVDPSDYGDYSDLDPTLHPRRILADAESFHKLGPLREGDRAARTRASKSTRNRSPIRRKLRDILYEAGEYPAHRRRDGRPSRRSSSTMATLEDAAEELAAILSFAARSPGRAGTMLLDLGYELPTTQYDTIGETEGQALPASRTRHRELGRRSRLGARASSTVRPCPPTTSKKSARPTPCRAPATTSPPRPTRRRREAARASARCRASRWTTSQDEAPRRHRPARRKPRGRGRSPTQLGPRTDSIEDALEEAEFFISRGLSTMRAPSSKSSSSGPGHPLLIERMRELDVQASNEAKARAARASGPLIERESAPARDRIRAFDIAASLDALDALDASHRARPWHSRSAGRRRRGLRQVQGRRRAQISETDSATHYDLGLAYQGWGSSRTPSTSSRSRRAIPSANACANR